MQADFKQDKFFPSFSSCMRRLEEKGVLLKQRDIAGIAGVSQAFVSKMKKEDKFPADWAFYISRMYDVSMEWILTGDYYSPEEGMSDTDLFIRDLRQWLLTFEDNKDKVNWFTMTFMKTFPEFEDFVYNLLNERLNADK